MGRHNQKVAECKPGRGFSLGTKSVGTLVGTLSSQSCEKEVSAVFCHSSPR